MIEETRFPKLDPNIQPFTTEQASSQGKYGNDAAKPKATSSCIVAFGWQCTSSDHMQRIRVVQGPERPRTCNVSQDRMAHAKPTTECPTAHNSMCAKEPSVATS